VLPVTPIPAARRGCYYTLFTKSGTRKAAMKIYGDSQSSGVERQLKIERGIDWVVLTLTDTVGSFERGWINVPEMSWPRF
jgi:hypothetical protein